ncbi:MAG: hypothetical protein HYZ81_07540 [Nitrospinae bacterium]|nr:hypothetical protein [Nitrospinota bacterium]
MRPRIVGVIGGSEVTPIAFALKMQKPVVGLGSWSVTEDVIQVNTPQEAVARAFELLESTGPRRR